MVEPDAFWSSRQGKRFLRHFRWRKRKYAFRRWSEKVFGWPHRPQFETLMDDFSDMTRATGTITKADLLAAVEAIEARDRPGHAAVSPSEEPSPAPSNDGQSQED